MPQKLIIDADPGIGDAFAVLTALSDPALSVLAVTASAGAVSGLQATRNLQYLIDLVDPVRHPRIGAASGASVVFSNARDQVRTRHSFCGNHGLGELDVNVPDLHNRRESAKLMVDLVNEHPGEIQILTLGPLTNVGGLLLMLIGY